MNKIIASAVFLIFSAASVFAEDGDLAGPGAAESSESSGPDAGNFASSGAAESSEEKTETSQIRFINISDMQKSLSENESSEQIRINDTDKSAAPRKSTVFGIRGIMQIGYGELGSIFREDLMVLTKSRINETVDLTGGFAIYMRKTFEKGPGFQIEAGYTANTFGLKFIPADPRYEDYYTTADISYDTFNFSLFACYPIPVTKLVSVTPLAGIQVGFVTGGFEIHLDDELYYGFDGDSTVNIIYGDLDTVTVTSLVAGVNVSIGLFVIDARFNYSLNPVEVEGFEIATCFSGAISAGFEFKL